MADDFQRTVLERLDAITKKLDNVEAKVDNLVTKVGNIETKLDNIETEVHRLSATQMNEQTRQKNAVKSNTTALNRLPFTADGIPWPPEIKQPETFNNLAVSGAQDLPGQRGVRNPWSKNDSKAFLCAAVPDYDDGESDTDDDDESGDKARTRRMRVIVAMGGSIVQVVAQSHRL